MADKESLIKKRIFLKKRKWVNMELKKRTKGKKGINPSQVLSEIWEEAHRKFR